MSGRNFIRALRISFLALMIEHIDQKKSVKDIEDWGNTFNQLYLVYINRICQPTKKLGIQQQKDSWKNIKILENNTSK